MDSSLISLLPDPLYMIEHKQDIEAFDCSFPLSADGSSLTAEEGE
jgi:hypothetical protein